MMQGNMQGKMKSEMQCKMHCKMQCKIQCELGIWYQDVSDFAILEVMLQNQTQPDTKCNSFSIGIAQNKTKAIWNIAIKKKRQKKPTIKSCLRQSRRAS